MGTYPYPEDDPDLHTVESSFSHPGERRSGQELYSISPGQRLELEPYLPRDRSTFLKEYLEFPSGSRGAERKSREPKDVTIPHVTLTYAQSLDGQISLNPGVRTQISGAETKAMTQYLRSRHDAILIGQGTANADNPGLNMKYSNDGVSPVGIGIARQPRPIVLDPSRKWQTELCPKLFKLAEDGQGRPPWTIHCISTGDSKSPEDEQRASKLGGVGGGIIDAGSYSRTEDGIDWKATLAALGASGIRSIMIEGGGTVIKDLLRARNQHLIDSLIVTIAPTYLGEGGVTVAPFKTEKNRNECILTDVKWLHYGDDIVMAWRSKQSRHYEQMGTSGGEI